MNVYLLTRCIQALAQQRNPVFGGIFYAICNVIKVWAHSERTRLAMCVIRRMQERGKRER